MLSQGISLQYVPTWETENFSKGLSTVRFSCSFMLVLSYISCRSTLNHGIKVHKEMVDGKNTPNMRNVKCSSSLISNPISLFLSRLLARSFFVCLPVNLHSISVSAVTPCLLVLLPPFISMSWWGLNHLFYLKKPLQT